MGLFVKFVVAHTFSCEKNHVFFSVTMMDFAKRTELENDVHKPYKYVYIKLSDIVLLINIKHKLFYDLNIKMSRLRKCLLLRLCGVFKGHLSTMS
jgi:hypothetical protein